MISYEYDEVKVFVNFPCKTTAMLLHTILRPQAIYSFIMMFSGKFAHLFSFLSTLRLAWTLMNFLIVFCLFSKLYYLKIKWANNSVKIEIRSLSEWLDDLLHRRCRGAEGHLGADSFGWRPVDASRNSQHGAWTILLPRRRQSRQGHSDSHSYRHDT